MLGIYDTIGMGKKYQNNQADSNSTHVKLHMLFALVSSKDSL